MAPEPIKCTLKNFGTFSTPTFGGVGEPFNDGRQRESRTTGRQFSTNRPRMGQIGDNWNRGPYGKRVEFKRLFEGEKYRDPHKFTTELEMKEREKNLTTNGFRYSSPNQKSSGLGHYWGCIGPKNKHVPEYEVLKKDDKPGPVAHELAQVKNNPPKKGYGACTPGIIFGPGPGKDETPIGRYGGREYAHAVDPYDLARQKEQADRKAGTDKLLGRPPFLSMRHAVDFFDGKPHLASSEVFTENPRIPEKPPPPPAAAPISTTPFFPSKAPKSGPQGTFNKFPEYKEDPLHLKIEAAKKAAAEQRIAGAAPFKLGSPAPYTVPTPTIVFHVPGGAAL